MTDFRLRGCFVFAAVMALLSVEPTGSANLPGSSYREAVMQAMTNIENRLGDEDLDRKGRKALRKAIDELSLAVEDLAADDIRSALRHVKRAVRKLEKAEARGTVVPDGLDRLVEVARQAALDMLVQAERYAGGSKKIDRLIGKASRQLEKAEQAWAEGNAKKAIRHARNAWKKAFRAAALGLETIPPPPDLETFTLPTFCAGPLQVQGVNAFVCEFPFNWVFEASDFEQFATTQFGVTIQAVGGNGGDGGSTFKGTVGAGAGGQPGLAQTTIRGDALLGKSLYIYVGNNGVFGAAGKGGSGGAATVVATAKLGPTPSTLDEMLVAAGGGGGGHAFTGLEGTCIQLPLPSSISDYVFINCDGGDGGVAIAIDEQDRFGFGRLGSTPPVYIAKDDGSMYVAGLGAGQPAWFNDNWVGGAGAGGASDGWAEFSFAGAPGSGSTATWVRETTTLELGTATVLGGQGSGAGGGGGGGVAGGGGSAAAGGAGGASHAVGSSYGLGTGETFEVPCDPSGFCAKNWLSPAGTDEPVVVITFWQNLGADPIVPKDNEIIETDQPSLVYNGPDAGSGIQYLLENDLDDIANYRALNNGNATGNVLWTVPSGLLEADKTYEWLVTDSSGKQLQAPRSFTIKAGTSASGSRQGWTLYVRSMNNLDTDLPADLQPLDGQNVPTLTTTCGCTCSDSSLVAPLTETPLLGNSEYQNCQNAPTKHYSDGCTCNWKATGERPTQPGFWAPDSGSDWTLGSGTACNASSGNCYANAEVHVGTIDIDWASPTNALNLQVPSRLINITSEPYKPADGTPVPSLSLPAIDGFSGSCADPTSIQVNFTTQTNGGARFFIYADPETGDAISSPTPGVNHWSTATNDCEWKKQVDLNGPGGTDLFTIAYMEAQVFNECQDSLAEQTGGRSFCLQPGTPYRVRFDAMVPYLPGPMRLGFKLAGTESSAPIPANWISTCILDGTTNNCETATTNLVVSPQQVFGKPELVTRPFESTSGDLLSRKPLAAPVEVEAPSSPDEGTAGAASCTGTATSVQCIWTQNGTWELPAFYTQPGNWIVVQALGGKGGDGGPVAGNSGGAPGWAQAVLPAEALAGKTLYTYVGESGADAAADGIGGAGGGAASLVTTAAVPQTFVNNGCSGTAASLEALAIAGGGGGGGFQQNTQGTASGSDGGLAIGRSGIQQTIGAGRRGGQAGGSLGGQPPAYGNNPFDGGQTVSGGYSADPGSTTALTSGSGALALGGAGTVSDDVNANTRTRAWLKNSSFLTLSRPADDSVCGGGETDFLGAGYGGGGHAGGGAGSPQSAVVNNLDFEIFAAGGAGGSSWVTGAGAGVTLPADLSSWQVLSNTDPSQVVITVHCPDCALLSECAMEQASERPVMRCTFTRSVESLSLATVGLAVGELIGQDVADEVPVYLEAWGGRGGLGGNIEGFCCGATGGGRGGRGYARSSHTYGSLTAASPTLWLYVGANGIDGGDLDSCSTNAGLPGRGGAASMLLSQPLSTETDLADVMLIAAGGGGGGPGYCLDDLPNNGLSGESASHAVATTSGFVSVAGQGDASGGDGTAGCLSRATCGNDGIGGLGGGVLDGPETGWVGTSSSRTQGQGGHSVGYNLDGSGREGGAGGGGHGGGGVGNIDVNHRLRGGGAGGSYAAQATFDDSGAPVKGGDPTSDSGAVVIAFDVCKTYPTLSVCQP